MRRLGAIILSLGIAVALPGCSDDNETDAATTSSVASVEAVDDLPNALADVDLLVRMMPGAGVGPRADQLAGEMGDAIPGTADHIASVATAGGVVNIVGYQEIMRGEPSGPMFCVAELGPQGGGAACGTEPITEPQAGGFSLGEGRVSISAYGGEGAPFAVLVTEKGARIGIVTVRGWAFAEWSSSWGNPDAITFYDGDGNAGYQESYDWMM